MPNDGYHPLAGCRWWRNSVTQQYKKDDPPQFRNGFVDALIQIALLTFITVAINGAFSLLATPFGSSTQLDWWLTAASACAAWLVTFSLKDWRARRWNRQRQTIRQELHEGITVDARYAIDGEIYTVKAVLSDDVVFASDAAKHPLMSMTTAGIAVASRNGTFQPLDPDGKPIVREGRKARRSWRGVPRWGGRVALLVIAAALFADRADSFAAATLVIFAVAWAMFELRALWRYRGAGAARSTAMNAFHWPGHPWLGRVVDWALLGASMLAFFLASLFLSAALGLPVDGLSWVDTQACVLALIFGTVVHDGAALLWNRDHPTDDQPRRTTNAV